MGADVGVGTDEDPAAALVGADPADRQGSLVVTLQPEGTVCLAHDEWPRQEGRQVGGHGDGAGTRSAAAVGRRERLVEVEMHDVEAGCAGPEAAQHGIHVGAVHVRQRTGGMDGLEELDDVGLEEPQRRRVREHDGRRPRTERAAQCLEVHPAVRSRRHGDRAEASHRGRGRVRAMGGVGHDDLVALGVAAAVVPGPDDEDAGQLAVGARSRLQADGREATDLAELLLERPQQLERALGQRIRGQRMELREAGPPSRPLVDLGVVLHRA